MTESTEQTTPGVAKAKLINRLVDVVDGVHAIVRALEEAERFVGVSKASRPLAKQILVFYGLCEAMIGELGGPGGGVAAIKALACDMGAKLGTVPPAERDTRDLSWLTENTIHLFDVFRSMSQNEVAFRATVTNRKASQALTRLRSEMDRTVIRLDLLSHELGDSGVDLRLLEKRAARQR